MIATGLTFLLGALVVALFVLLIAPVVWNKAQSLARRDYAATIPVSANEIRAEFDAVRAEAALGIRRAEIKRDEARDKMARAQADLGRSAAENVELQHRNRKLTQLAEEREAEIARLTTNLAAKNVALEEETDAHGSTRRESERLAEELQALEKRFGELGGIAEERKLQLIAAETRLDSLGDSLRGEERLQREHREAVERIRAEVAAAERKLTQERENAAALQKRVEQLTGDLADRDEKLARLAERAVAAKSPDIVAAPDRRRSSWGTPAVATEKAEPPSAAQRLRAALGKNGEPASASEADDIRERISDIAARVIRMSALAAGPQSPLAELVQTGTADGPDRSGEPLSLAERVRKIVEAERRAPADALPVQAAGGRPE